MIDLLVQAGLSNAGFALALAIVAKVVGAKSKRPHLAHLLWLIVFIKLVTPPVVTIPVVAFSVQSEAAGTLDDQTHLRPSITDAHDVDIDTRPDGLPPEPVVVAATPFSLRPRIGTVWNHGRPWLVSVWLLGSVVVFTWSLLRVFRFNRLLVANTESAPQELQSEAEKVASRLGLITIPELCTTSARIPPMVWWVGGRPLVVIPNMLLDQMDATKWRWVLAHELAHVRRRDYMVRWLEWLACVLFWWNPVVWWAGRNLRAMEEICCDALVLSSMRPKPRSYANSILMAVESFACPDFRPPAMASEINSGGLLERRFRMIVSDKANRSNSRWLKVCVLMCAVVILPFGVAYSQDGKERGEAFKVTVTDLNAKVMAGSLTAMEGFKNAGKTAVRIGFATEKEVEEELENLAKLSEQEVERKWEKKFRSEAGNDKERAKRGKEFKVIVTDLNAKVKAGSLTAMEGFKNAGKSAVRIGFATEKEVEERLEKLAKLPKEEVEGKWDKLMKEAKDD